MDFSGVMGNYHTLDIEHENVYLFNRNRKPQIFRFASYSTIRKISSAFPFWDDCTMHSSDYCLDRPKFG